MKQIAFLPLSAALAVSCIGQTFAQELNLIFEKSKISVTRLSNVSDTDPEIKVAIYSTEFFKPQRSENYSFSKVVEILALDCSESKYIILNLTWFDARGNQVNAANFPNELKQGNWVLPGQPSIAKRMVDFACRQKAG